MANEGFSEPHSLVLSDIPTQTLKEMFLQSLCLKAILLPRSLAIRYLPIAQLFDVSMVT